MYDLCIDWQAWQAIATLTAVMVALFVPFWVLRREWQYRRNDSARKVTEDVIQRLVILRQHLIIAAEYTRKYLDFDPEKREIPLSFRVPAYSPGEAVTLISGLFLATADLKIVLESLETQWTLNGQYPALLDYYEEIHRERNQSEKQQTSHKDEHYSKCYETLTARTQVSYDLAYKALEIINRRLCDLGSEVELLEKNTLPEPYSIAKKQQSRESAEKQIDSSASDTPLYPPAKAEGDEDSEIP